MRGLAADADLLTAILDCNALLQAAISGSGPAAGVLEDLEAGRFVAVFSDEIRREIEDVLSRPHLRRKYPALTDDKAAALLHVLETQGRHIDPVPAALAYLRDPNDEKYLNLAAHVQPAYLVTRDKDLLTLQEDDAFQTKCPKTRILDPAAFRQALRGAGDPANIAVPG